MNDLIRKLDVALPADKPRRIRADFPPSRFLHEGDDTINLDMDAQRVTTQSPGWNALSFGPTLTPLGFNRTKNIHGPNFVDIDFIRDDAVSEDFINFVIEHTNNPITFTLETYTGIIHITGMVKELTPHEGWMEVIFEIVEFSITPQSSWLSSSQTVTLGGSGLGELF